ncbi:hypothetical protein [Streptomyces cylindrosporus]|uniref:Uncharacterized protein n=1 Tax=Streptomyces cylindrosporus TaxID=2927583 RepID=A0ABS9YJP1_9ACTN|nr:hypothetical protein [Streptomyces cylindrosporus]MCI3277467.1 hypothetical protein [Streptomyces cylindrosporus]
MTLTDAELDQLIEDIGLKRPDEDLEHGAIEHGTEKGALQHRHREERLCPRCRQAVRDAYDQRRYGRTGYLTEAEWQAQKGSRGDGGEKP